MKFRFNLLPRRVVTSLATFFDLCKCLFLFLFFSIGNKVTRGNKLCRYTVSIGTHIFRDMCVQRARQSRKNTLLGVTLLLPQSRGVAHA